MKKFFTFLFLTVVFFAVSAQSVDFEILGFADSDGNPISSIVLNSSQDLQPRVILKNNGPDVVPVTDSIIFDITYDEGYYVTSLILTGTDLHSVLAGDSVFVDLLQPIWTADIMSHYGLTECTLCYEVRIVGRATDPNPDNNRACIEMTRSLGIHETSVNLVTLFPNPASSTVTLAGVANACVQLFDMSGRMVSVIESASENQSIDVSSLAEGFYIVRIIDGQNSTSKKLNVIR